MKTHWASCLRNLIRDGISTTQVYKKFLNYFCISTYTNSNCQEQKTINTGNDKWLQRKSFHGIIVIIKLHHKCDICDKHYSEHYSLDKHKELNIYACNQCECKVSNKEALEIHTSSSHKVNENKHQTISKKYLSKRIKCNICDRKFCKPITLHQENRISPPQWQGFICSRICFYQLITLHQENWISQGTSLGKSGNKLKMKMIKKMKS